MTYDNPYPHLCDMPFNSDIFTTLWIVGMQWSVSKRSVLKRNRVQSNLIVILARNIFVVYHLSAEI